MRHAIIRYPVCCHDPTSWCRYIFSSFKLTRAAIICKNTKNMRSKYWSLSETLKKNVSKIVAQIVVFPRENEEITT